MEPDGMVAPEIQDAILEALEAYSADHDTSFAPDAFVGWMRRHRPAVLDRVGEQTVIDFSSYLISRAARQPHEGAV